MDFPLLLVGLLALPFVVAAVILAVSRARRPGGKGEPAHRLQSDTAAVQSAAVQSTVEPRAVQPARERRAQSGEKASDG